jgi:Fe-S oxidoreductase
MLEAPVDGYWDADGGIDVYHYTHVVEELVRDGRLALGSVDRTVTYHDPCHLGRYNGEYEAPARWCVRPVSAWWRCPATAPTPSAVAAVAAVSRWRSARSASGRSSAPPSLDRGYRDPVARGVRSRIASRASPAQGRFVRGK